MAARSGRRGGCLVCLLVSVVVVGGWVLWQQHGVQWRVAGGGGAGRGPSVGRTASVTVPGSDGGCHLQVIGARRQRFGSDEICFLCLGSDSCFKSV